MNETKQPRWNGKRTTVDFEAEHCHPGIYIDDENFYPLFVHLHLGCNDMFFPLFSDADKFKAWCEIWSDLLQNYVIRTYTIKIDQFDKLLAMLDEYNTDASAQIRVAFDPVSRKQGQGGGINTTWTEIPSDGTVLSELFDGNRN